MSLRRNAAFALIALTSVTGAACGGDDGDERASEPAGQTATSGDTATETTGSTGGEAAAPGTITLKLIKFRPDRTEVTAGTKVTWVQDDVAAHTVTSGPVEKGPSGVTAQSDGLFDSGNITKGEKFEFTFEQAGEFPYYCAIHPATMTGVVVVK